MPPMTLPDLFDCDWYIVNAFQKYASASSNIEDNSYLFFCPFACAKKITQSRQSKRLT
jgi:hypothetical protein